MKTEFKKGDKVRFCGETYEFKSYYNYQAKNDFAIIWNGKERDYQPVDCIEKI